MRKPFFNVSRGPLYLAGAFGNYVQARGAIRIGLIEAPLERIEAAGNTALRGAKHLLLAAHEPVLPRIEHVSLASDARFQEEFAGCMAFPEPEVRHDSGARSEVG